MHKEKINVTTIKGPEFKIIGPKSLDPLTSRLTVAGLILYDCFTFRHIFDTGYISVDFAKRTASLEWRRLKHG